MHKNHLRAYRGWRSTKLHLALVAMAVIVAGYVLTGFPAAAFNEFVFGVLGAAAIYSGAAAAEKFTPPANDAPPPAEGS